MVDLLAESGAAFSEYLQAYTNASVALLGRWPAFVAEEDRYADTLEPGSAAGKRVFGDHPAELAAFDTTGRMNGQLPQVHES